MLRVINIGGPAPHGTQGMSANSLFALPETSLGFDRILLSVTRVVCIISMLRMMFREYGACGEL